MKRVILLCVVSMLTLAGCTDTAAINKFCAPKGGTLASDWQGDTVTCANGIVYPMP